MNTHRPSNREIIRKIDLNDEDGTLTPVGSSAAERLLMVWRITQDSWVLCRDTMLNENFRDMLLAVNDAGVEFLLVGAYALAAHGCPRATGDIDFWVRANSENAERVFPL